MSKENKEVLHSNKQILMDKYKKNIECFQFYSNKDMNIAANRRYYAFLQFLKYTIVKYMEFDPNEKYGVNGGKNSSHLNILECFLVGLSRYLELKYGKHSKENRVESTLLKGLSDNFDSVKDIRVEADYYAKDITISQFIKIRTLCEEFENKIRKYEEEGVLSE